MLKFAVLLYKKPGNTLEEFRNFLLGVHGPLARKIPGLRRCIYNVVLPDATRKAPEWSAIVELYFDDFDSMQAAWATPEGRAATDDLVKFADLSRTSWSIVEETAIL